VPYRLEWPRSTTVFEIDQPMVLKFKARVMAEHSAEAAADRRDVAADLRDDWSIPLKAAGFDPTLPSAWSVEGILPYLNSDAQDTLFSRITDLTAPGSRLAIGALGSCLNQDRLSALEERYPGLNLSGDVDFSTLTYDDATKTKPAQWLTDHGWAIDPVRTNPELQREYRRTPAQVDLDLDEIMHSEYISATR
jgi:methyltransferase (TIGR00027 family)